MYAQHSELDSLENLLNQHEQKDTVKVNLLNKIADLQIYVDNQKALQLAEKSGELSDELGFTAGKAESFRLLGIYRSIKSDFPEAIEYFTIGLELNKRIGDRNGESKCLNGIGVVYTQQGNYYSAFENLKLSLEICEDLGDEEGIARANSNMGVIYYKQGNYLTAQECNFKSLSAFEIIGNKYGIGSCLNNIGLIYAEQESYSKAIIYYEKALSIHEENKNWKMVSGSLNNIGNIYIHLEENLQLALEYHQRSLKIRQEHGLDIGLSQENIGRVFLGLKDYNQALDYLNRSLLKRNEIGDKFSLCAIYDAIGRTYYEMGYYSQAIDNFLKGLNIANEIELLKYQTRLNGQLAKTYSSLKNYPSAFEYLEAHNILNDSLNNVERITKITALDEQYKFEKEKLIGEAEQRKREVIIEEERQQQKIMNYSLSLGFILMLVLALMMFRNISQKRKANLLLAQQKKKIEDDNQLLAELNSTQSTFFSIIAHDLRGPLGSLKNLGEFMYEMHEDLDKEKEKKYLQLIAQDSKKTFTLLDNLLKWSSSSSGRMLHKPEEFQVNIMLKENAALFKTSIQEKKIKLVTHLEEGVTVFGDTDMINTVLRNLISNSIKFTSEEGRIEIISKKVSPTRIEVGIIDSGVGIHPDVIPKLFKIDTKNNTLGTNKEEGSGLGLKLCKEFVDKNDGEIRVESELGKGTEFWVSLPSGLVVG